MFLGPRRDDEPLFIVVKSSNGVFQMALGEQTRTYRSAEDAAREASRLASKLNDGRYYVFQAVSVSEVVTPRAVNRPLASMAVESRQLSRTARDLQGD